MHPGDKCGASECGDAVYEKLLNMEKELPMIRCVRHPNGTVARLVNSYELQIFKACEGFPVFPLYMVTGLAPTYYSPHLGGKFANVKMNWIRNRTHPLLIDYSIVFGEEPYSLRNVQAVNQLFLAEEAHIFKTWIDAIYPEENTTVYEMSYPITTDIDFIPESWYVKNEGGVFLCFEPRWRWDWIITYWVDVRECEKVSDEP